MFFEVASVVIDAIRMFEFTKETYFFEYVLPFLQGLFATIWHLFDGHDLKFEKKSSNYSMSITDSKKLNLIVMTYGKILQHITLRLQTLLDLKSYYYRAVGSSEKLVYSCNNITTTLIQISRLFYFGFFTKTNHQMII